MEFKASDLLLYLVTDRRWLKEGESLEEVVELAIKNGVSFVQLREKDADYKTFKDLAIRLKRVTDRYKIPFVINDNVKLATEIDADGIHIGQEDMHIDEARKLLGNSDKIIGVSASNMEEALEAEKNGADYLGVGAVFSTDTKSVEGTISLEELKEINERVDIPIVGIGGINLENIDQLRDTKIAGVSLISAILAADDIELSTKKLREKTKELFN